MAAVKHSGQTGETCWTKNSARYEPQRKLLLKQHAHRNPISNIRSLLLRFSTIFCLGLVTLLCQQQSEPLLDLTRPDPRPEQATGTGSGGGVGGSDTRIEDPPFQMTLEGVEPGEYPFGSRLVYEVVLENTSDSGFVIPWGGMPERALIRPNPGSPQRPPGYRHGALVLTFETADGQNEWIGSKVGELSAEWRLRSCRAAVRAGLSVKAG